jgi:glucose/arabinose dehydrogenase
MLCGVILMSGCVLPVIAQETPKRTLLKSTDLPEPFATPSANNGAHIIPRPAGTELKLPAGFKAEVIAEGFDNPRWVTAAPNGDIFVAEAGPGRIVVLRPGTDGKIGTREVFAEGLQRPFGMVFWRDWLFVGTPSEVLRFAYKPGQTKADSTPPQAVVSGLPTDGHWTRSLTVNPRTGKLYVSLGSQADIAELTDTRRATVCEFNPDGSGFRVYGSGLRNAVGLACNPQTSALWASVQERDQLGDDLVPDFVTSVKEGGFYGWPYYYIGRHPDSRVSAHPELADKCLVPDVLLTSHTAAMCMLFYTGHQFPSQYRGDAFVALHGSSNRALRVGYSIIRIPFKNGKPVGGYEDFVTGWMLAENDNRVWGRPVGLALAKDGSLLMIDDGANKLWRISYSK